MSEQKAPGTGEANSRSRAMASSLGKVVEAKVAVVKAVAESAPAKPAAKTAMFKAEKAALDGTASTIPGEAEVAKLGAAGGALLVNCVKLFA